MLSLRHPEVKIRRVLRSAKGYLVPRADGRILAGSTLEDAGFEKAVTPAGMQKIMNAARELVPALVGAEIVEKWAGLRPGTPDNLPILGPTDLPGLIVATGHYRNGILLAPVTAKLVRAWVCGEPASPDATSFSPQRFTRQAASLAAESAE
jgi:glycine oxidase